MNNNIIKFYRNVVANEDLTKLFELEDTKVYECLKKSRVEYDYEYDEIVESKLVKTKIPNKNLLDDHYEFVVMQDNEGVYCPHCGEFTNKIHDYYTRPILAPKFNGIISFFMFKQRRYRCCNCSINIIQESKDFPKGIKVSKRENEIILERLKENVSRATISREEGVSQNHVKKLLDACDSNRRKLGYIICIDEFKGNMYSKKDERTRKYQTNICDPTTGRIIDILPNRDKTALVNYFSEIPFEERKKVEIFISDMNPTFMSIGKKYFPNAIVVVDRYHYTEVATNAFEYYRKKAQNKMSHNLQLAFKQSRHMLLMRREEAKKKEILPYMLSAEQMIEYAPLLRTPYELLQEFYEINDSKDIAVARIRMAKFFEHAEKSGYEKFVEAVKTLRRKMKQILNSFLTTYTNAYVEGKNNLIKVIKRVAYGLKNLERFKKRLYLITDNYVKLREERKILKLIRERVHEARHALKIKVA